MPTTMKKLLLFILLVCMTFYTSAQGFYSEFNIGLPTGDISDNLKLELNGKFGYLWSLSPNLGMGLTGGISYIFTKEEDKLGGLEFLDNPTIFTISPSIRHNVSKYIVLGADIGFGHLRGFIDGSSGSNGFYYRPIIGVKISPRVSINASYVGLSLNEDGQNYDLNSFNSLQIGLSFGK